MLKNLSAAVTVCIAVVLHSCASESLSNPSEDSQISSISNSELTLHYGTSDLAKNVDLKNTKMNFVLFDPNGQKMYSNTKKNQSYTADLSNAIPATGSNWININNSETYYIPAGTTFTGGFNFNSPGKIIILGNLGGSNWLNVPNGGTVDVGDAGKILSSSNFHLNSGGKLNNYGVVEYNTSSVDGIINNFNALNFKQGTSLNGSSAVNNYCKMTFESANNYLNANVVNNSYLSFKQGFHINGSGILALKPQSYTEVSGGNISIDGKIKNTDTGFARMDIINSTIGYINANPAVMGMIDLNFVNTPSTNLQAPKSNAQVTFNANQYIAADECVPQKGVLPCSDSQLQFTWVANVVNPTGNNQNLSATSVKVSNNFAYVSYHTNDATAANTTEGAVRILNVSNSVSPALINEAIFNNLEFNSVDVYGDKLYAVGGNKNGARILSVPLLNNTFDTQNLSLFSQYSLPSATAKSSYFYNNYIYAVTGATGGGFFKLNPSSNFSVAEQYATNTSHAKFAAHNENYHVFFAAESNGAFVRISNADGSNVHSYTYPELAQNTTDGKNVVVLDSEYAYIALSDKGVAKIKLSNGQLINTFVPKNYTQAGQAVFSQSSLTNGVAVSDCYLYLANGSDGIIVLNKNSFQVVGNLKLNSSANYIYIQNNLAYVATGKGGLNIIKIN